MSDFNLYDFAFEFWSLLITEQQNLAGGTALANLEVPFLFSNAAWYPKIGKLKTVAEWYARRRLPPALIVPTERNTELERSLQEGLFSLEHSFGFQKVHIFSLLSKKQDVTIEQTSWTQTRVTGDLLALHYNEPSLGIAIGKSLSVAMQNSSQIRNYIAYAEKPVAAMVTFEQNGILAAMLCSQSKLFSQTLLEEASHLGLEPYIFETASHTNNKTLCLERWSIQ
jgi:hypothetical protein